MTENSSHPDSLKDVDFPSEKLPDGWTASAPYDTQIRLDSPPDSASQVLIQLWEQDDVRTYNVIPMVPASGVPGAESTNDPQNSESWEHIENAINYAVGQADRLASR